MSFINKSVNYSQTNLLKTNFLSTCLNKITDSILKISKNNIPSMNYYIIPNNGKKYYAYITDTNTANNINNTNNNSNSKINLIYLFPDEKTLKHTSENKTEINQVTDFFLEIDSRFTKECLFEGYLYKSDHLYNRYTYLITDILYLNDTIVNFDYASRYTLLNETISSIPKSLRYLNDHLTIGIHPIFDSNNENIVKIFMNNFIFKKDIHCIEHVYSPFTKKIFIQNQNVDSRVEEKKLKKTQYADVYDVYNIKTGNPEGILYVKGVEHSKFIKQLFLQGLTNSVLNQNTTIEHICKYNTVFNKWEILLPTN